LVAVFRSPVFNQSETFVRAQAAGLERYQPLVVGLEDKGHVPPALAGRVLLASGAGERLAIRLLGRWGALGEKVRAADPVLLHAHFGPDGVLALPLARALGIPLVTSLRGYDVTRTVAGQLASGRFSLIRHALGRRALMREGDLFLAVSDALRRRAVARGYPAARILTHYNGVDLHAFRPSGADDKRTILHVGRLVEKKGTRVLLAAFVAVRAERPDARLTIIGEGPLRRTLEGMAKALGMSDAVQFLGRRPQAEIAAWMGRAALLAVPSLVARDGDAEGLPNVVVEAAAAGLPVVASDHEGIPEAVDEGQSGFLVPEGEPEPLARRIAALLADEDMRRTMGAAGRALAEERFDAIRQMRLLEARYDALIGARTRTKAIETR
jgi:colanic acid/amylovoran biosynthesis glycosyltransferase